MMRRAPHRRVLQACLVSVALCGLTISQAAGSETIYMVSKSGGTLLSFDSANSIDLSDQQAFTPVTTLATGLQQPAGLALGPDGRLYIAEWGNGSSIAPRVSRYDIGTGQWAPLVSLNATTQIQPSAIAFRPAGLGGEMLVGRVGRLDTTGEGDMVSISGWNTGSPTVSSTPYNSGITLNGSSGLAVAANGTTYVSNSQYSTVLGNPIFQGTVVELNASGAYQRQVVANGLFTGGLQGPAGLVLDGTNLYTGSVTNSKVYRTNLGTLSTSEFGSVGPNFYFEIGPILQTSDGTILGGSVTGTAVVYRFLQPSGTLSSHGYFNNDFGMIGGMVIANVPEPATGMLVVAAAGLIWAVGRRPRGRRTS